MSYNVRNNICEPDFSGQLCWWTTFKPRVFLLPVISQGTVLYAFRCQFILEFLRVLGRRWRTDQLLPTGGGGSSDNHRASLQQSQEVLAPAITSAVPSRERSNNSAKESFCFYHN